MVRDDIPYGGRVYRVGMCTSPQPDPARLKRYAPLPACRNAPEDFERITPVISSRKGLPRAQGHLIASIPALLPLLAV